MAINTIAMATKMSENVERAIIQKSAAGFLADNDLKAKFVGGKTVSIPQMTTDGLADYDRDTGFVRGAVSVTRKTYTLSMDRGKSFQIDGHSRRSPPPPYSRDARSVLPRTQARSTRYRPPPRPRRSGCATASATA